MPLAEHKDKAQPNSLQKAWEDFDKSGDATQFLEQFTDDVVYHVGTGPFAGDHKGKGAVGDLFGKLQDLTAGTARAKPIVTLYDDQSQHEYAVTLAENRFRAGGEWHTTLFTHVAHLKGDKIDELWTFSQQPDLPGTLKQLEAQGKKPG